MNDSKTEVLLVGSKRQMSANVKKEICVNGHKIMIGNSVKDLCVHLDSEMKMALHVSFLIRSLYFGLKQISNIRNYISIDTCKKLVVSLLFSKLDYCNSLLTNLPSHSLKKLQTFQNQAAKLVFRKKKYDHATPLLFSLHWLPVECRIHYKIACIVFKSINGEAPTYLSDHIAIYTPERNLRSSNDKKKLVKRTHKTKFGE